MSSLISGLAGAGGAANTAGGYYTNAANDIYNQYGPSATQQFLSMQNNALRPQFNQEVQNLSGAEAAQGITHSGAGRANYGNLGSQQSSALAGVDAPLFSQGLNAASGVYAQMPGAQEGAYNDAIQQFYQALSGAGQAAAGIPPNFGSGPTGSTDNGDGGGGYYGGAPGAYGGMA